MVAYKEIVTKAVIGKAKKSFKNTYSVQAENTPTTILGCWVINHKFNGYKKENEVGVNGTYDVNIWYSYDNDTKTDVVKKQIDYNDLFNVTIREQTNLSDNSDIIVRSLKQPTCSKVDIKKGDIIEFNIEKELGVEVVGEAKMKIAIEEDEEPWEEITEEVDDKTESEIDQNIDENYLEKNTN